ncbi:FAD-dependent oxidoreductase [Chloroflexota bacterium]
MSVDENQKYMVIFQPSGRRGYINGGKTIKEASVALGVDIEGICGEKAICGKCKIRIEEGVFEKYAITSNRENLSPMGVTERKFFNIQHERHGYRLACQAKIMGNIVVYVPEESRMGKQVVRKEAKEINIEIKPAIRKYYVELKKASLDDPLGDWDRLQNELSRKFKLSNLTIDYQVLLGLQNAIREGDWKVTVSVWQDKEVTKVDPGIVEKGYGLAVDVGTTTVAGYLCDLTDGKVIATASAMNPQVIYGEDVMSRISYTITNPNGLEQLNQAIIDGINGIVEDATALAGIKRQDILDMSIVGNTCMHHILLNVDPQYIGRSPFPPVLHHSLDIKARDLGLKILPEVETHEKGSYPPCQVTCPAKVNGQDFLYLIAQGKFDEALEEVRRAFPFAGVCGRVCTHPCETECERGEVDDPLSIRYLHRFVADYELKVGRVKITPIEQTKEDKVAVVGSGPAGLACAYELVRRGYPVTVFEATPEAGGMLRYGIPEYRLPKNILDNEIGYIKELGVEIKTSSPVGNLKRLFDQSYKAIFLATGAWVSQKMGIPNEDTKGVVHALDFLKQVNSGEKVEVGKRVAVIGGGNAALDTARIARRLGAREVLLIYRRTRNEMPAISSEIDEAEREGVKFQFLTTPVRVLVNGLQCIRTELGESDESGRQRPIPVKGSEFDIDIDDIIIAIGQVADATVSPTELEYTNQGTFYADPITLETNIKGIFAGGDAVSGPSNVISAVAKGQEAALSIELYLGGIDLGKGRPAPPKRVEDIPKEGVGTEVRNDAPVLEVEKRKGFAEVELGFSKELATQESKRCLNCSIFAEKESSQIDEVRSIGIKIAPGAYIHVLPIEAGFVGADNVGVLIAEAPYNQDSIEFVIDIGTNGELIMGNRHKLIASSCATGPAFEGAEIKHGMRAAPGAIETIEIDTETKEVRFKVIGGEDWNTDITDMGAKGICGSGIIDIAPQLFMAGIIDHTGRFNRELNNPRLRVTDEGPEFVIAWANETSISQDIVICQADVRNIQLAKAAMYAGAKIMMRRLGVDKLDKVILAGAFGSYIDKKSAACLGLFPDCDLENIYAVGNAAGDGARIALLNVEKRVEADKMARQVEYIELTVEPDFDKVFSQAMWLPHMKDTFPHLNHLLPQKTAKKT